MITESTFFANENRNTNYQTAINELRNKIDNLEKQYITQTTKLNNIIEELNTKIATLEKAKVALESDLVDLEQKLETKKKSSKK